MKIRTTIAKAAVLIVAAAVVCPVPYKYPPFLRMPRFAHNFSFLKRQRIPPAPVRPYRWLHEDEHQKGRPQ